MYVYCIYLQALLWEMGSEVAEKQQSERGGVNVTVEMKLQEDMQTWFTRGGGTLHFVETNISQEEGITLRATEDILDENQVIMRIPLKLIMCRQTARNVLIAKKGKYLGEELTKTFEKNEAWGMAIFLLHEYYKEVAGTGSKWGPFLRTLRMRSLTTEVLGELRGTKAAQLLREWTKEVSDFMWWSTGECIK